MKKEILKRIEDKEIIVGIIGLGYVGLPLAREFLNSEFKVLGFDIDEYKINYLKKGKSYIKHIDSDFIKKYVIDKKKFDVTSDFKRLKEADFIIICVPTPLDRHRNPDLQYVIQTTETIKQNLRKGHVVVLESTTYPGTTDEILLKILEKSGLKEGEDFFLGYSPEREDPGSKQYTTKTIPKIVSGISKSSLALIDALYSKIIVKTVPVSSTRIAEASKILENTYRAVNIALINELKIIFEKMGINIWEVIEAAKTKPFGFTPFYPGPGLGGHCIPIDPFYLTYKAKEYDYTTRFIELAGEVNTYQPYYVVEKAMEVLNNSSKTLRNAKILILGVAYKKDVDDTRESPAIKIMDILESKGAKVDYYDPYVSKLSSLRHYPTMDKVSIEYSPSKISEYDLIIIVTNHSNFNYQEILNNAKLILDTRGVYKDSPKVYRA